MEGDSDRKVIIDNRLTAWCGAEGTLCDAMGGIYLTYELLGGRSGPLGLITRAATYSLLFGLGYGIPFGPIFGSVAGIGLGTILAMEFWRVARHQRLYHSSPLYQVGHFGAARGLVLGLAAIHPFGLKYGTIFGFLTALGLYVVYAKRYAPTYDYDAKVRPVFNRHIVTASLLRGVVIAAAGTLASWIEWGDFHAMSFGLMLGAAAGFVSITIGLVSPFVEWWIENLPDKYLAVLGLMLICMGLVLQSVQYLVVIMNLQ